MRRAERAPEPGPQLTLAERDRRYAGLRALMEERGFDAIVVGSFQSRERLEPYLIDDFLDAVVVLPLKSDPVLLAFGGSRISRIFESQCRGFDVWMPDVRMSAGGAKVAELPKERSLEHGRIGVVGFGPTAPGEAEGLLPLGFHTNFVKAGLAAVKPGVTFASVVRAMEKPLAAAGCWSKTPLLHTLTFGSTGFTPVNREQLVGTREEPIEGAARPGIRRGELVLQEGMSLELEPNACLGMVRVNFGAGVLVTATGAEELNTLPTRLQHVR